MFTRVTHLRRDERGMSFVFIGMGFMDLQKQARAFIASRKDSATGNRIADLEAKLAAMQEQLKLVAGQSRQATLPRPDDTLAALTAAAAGR